MNKKVLRIIILLLIVLIALIIGIIYKLNNDKIDNKENTQLIEELETGNEENFIVKIENNTIIGEEYIDKFISKVKTTKQEISINIETSNANNTQKTILKYIPGNKTINEIDTNVISNIYTNFASPVLATEEISKEYGYYELTIKSDNDEYVKKFDTYNYFLKKNITENRTKIELQTELDVDYTLVLCEYNTIVTDITEDFLNSSRFLSGKIYKMTNDKIYFNTLDNKYYLLKNDANIKFLDGRTNVEYEFNNIKENYYINTSVNNEVFIFKNINGEDLKKELLINLSLSKENAKCVNTIGIKEINKIGNNEAIVTIVFGDLINSEYYENTEDSLFEIKVKFTNDTAYFSKGGNIYNVDTLNQAMGNINGIILNAKTIYNQYPEVLEFSSSDT